jgi:hypothetical protein
VFKKVKGLLLSEKAFLISCGSRMRGSPAIDNSSFWWYNKTCDLTVIVQYLREAPFLLQKAGRERPAFLFLSLSISITWAS